MLEIIISKPYIVTGIITIIMVIVFIRFGLLSKNDKSKNELQAGEKHLPVGRALFIDRFTAFFADYCVFGGFIGAILRFGDGYVNVSSGSFKARAIICVVLYLLIYVIVPCYNNGQTMCKQWSKLKVVDLNGNTLSLPHYFLRELVARFIPLIGMPFVGPYGLLWYLTYLLALNNERRALHDIIVGTQVIKVRIVSEEEG